MTNANTLSLTVILAVFIFATHVEAQTMAKFQRPVMQVSGGEVNFSNTAAATYGGQLGISSNGVVSGTIVRRNFANNATNSLAVIATVLTNSSRIFGTIVNEGSFTNVWTNQTMRQTNFTTVYAADFYIATSITNFFIKGRATQYAWKSIDVFYDGQQWGSPNTNTSLFVNLDGLAFGPGQTRGTFSAYKTDGN